MDSAKINKFTGPTDDEYSDMVVGKWEWSADGVTQNAYINLAEDNSCTFEDLTNAILEDLTGNCVWSISEETK